LLIESQLLFSRKDPVKKVELSGDRKDDAYLGLYIKVRADFLLTVTRTFSKSIQGNSSRRA
jgi:hypothetical protein